MSNTIKIGDVAVNLSLVSVENQENYRKAWAAAPKDQKAAAALAKVETAILAEAAPALLLKAAKPVRGTSAVADAIRKRG